MPPATSWRWRKSWTAFAVLSALSSGVSSYNPAGGDLCNALNDCSGHGKCNTMTKVCTCTNGWGSPSDVSNNKAADCSQRVCPAAASWNSIPTQPTTSHAIAECSGMGICNTATGECKCFPGFTGGACERTSCPKDCSGHGTCVSMKALAGISAAMPLSAPTTYGGLLATTTWDQDRIFGCVCDSPWPVGLDSGQVQASGWFGSDCSLQHCPYGDDPVTTSSNELDCSGVVAPGGFGTGAAGNVCFVECSNRGACNYTTGVCACFEGFHGGKGE